MVICIHYTSHLHIHMLVTLYIYVCRNFLVVSESQRNERNVNERKIPDNN